MFRKWQKTNPNYPIILGFMPAYRIYGYRHPIAIETCNYYWTATFSKYQTLTSALIVVLQNCDFKDEGANSKKSNHFQFFSHHDLNLDVEYLVVVVAVVMKLCSRLRDCLLRDVFNHGRVSMYFAAILCKFSIKNFKTRWNCLIDAWSFINHK